MSKPLELNVYQATLDHYEEPCYLNADGTELYVTKETAIQMAHEKRFTDAELAAEWWSAEATVRDIYTQSARNPYRREDAWKVKHQRRNTLHRFATTPSYDEVDS